MVALVDVNNPKERSNQLQLKKDQQRSRIPVRSDNKSPITPDSQQRVVTYYTTILATALNMFNVRPNMLMRDLAYYRENDMTRAQQLAKMSNIIGDASKIQNVTIPIVMPQVESALGYLTSVFLTGYPIFGSIAPPEFSDAIAQMDTIIGENSVRAGWPQELMKTLRNGLKYDLGVCEVTWETKKTYNIGTPQVSQITAGSVDETTYAGNVIKDLSPYNTILDTRVSPDRNHIEGEFAGYTELVSAVALKQRMDELDINCTMNFRSAFESPSTVGAPGNNSTGYYVPMINPSALVPSAQTTFSWGNFFAVAGSDKDNSIKYQDAYEWTVLYIRLIPTVFGITGAGRNHVQIWKFIVINQSVVIFAQKQVNAHSLLPIIACKPSNDGMMWQSKSFAQNAEPFQYVASALTNSAIESQRRKVYDRIYYDPLRINKKDIDNTSSVARIPVKNSNYNKDISSAVYAAPYRDEGVSDILSFSQNVTQMAEIANGQNRVQQGQFQKGNKTRQEFDTVMQNANSRQQMSAIALEYSFFTPIKEIIKSNILQFQPPISLVNSKSNSKVTVDPTVLRKAMMSFKLSDGLLPTSKMVGSEVFTTVLQTAQAIPAIQAEYDLMGMITYQLELQGADWLSDFKRTPDDQQKYMQTMTHATQAAGNAKPPQPAAPTTPAAA